MKKIINIQISKGDTHYIAECTDLPVVTQAKSLDELIFNLKEAIELHFEDEELAEYEIISKTDIKNYFYTN